MPMDTNSLAQLLNEYLTVTVLWGALGLALLAWSALVWADLRAAADQIRARIGFTPSPLL